MFRYRCPECKSEIEIAHPPDYNVGERIALLRCSTCGNVYPVNPENYVIDTNKLYYHNDPFTKNPIGKVVHSFVLRGELIFVVKLDGEEFYRQVKEIDSVELLDKENKE